MRRKELHNNIYFGASLLIAFSLPIYIYIVPFFIVILFLNWIAEGNFKEKFLFLKSKFLLLFISYYLLYLIGMIWTNNSNSGWFDLRIKLPILAFPLIASRLRDIIDTKKMPKILYSFVAGCFFATVICLSHACYMWFIYNENHYTYTKLSVVLHPSYMSMYILLSVVILLYGFFKNTWQNNKRIFVMILIIWFWFFIILLQSKAGILIASFMFLVFAIILFVVYKKYLQIIIPFLVIAGSYYCVNHFVFASGNSRIESAKNSILNAKIDTSTVESNQARILVWKASGEIIKSNFLYGVGTGDIKDELDKMYIKMNMTGIFEEHLNAHNQYLQSALGLGILGIINIILIFLLPFIYSIKEKNYLYAFFLIIVGLNLFVESMFETQAGVMFYAFFNILFFIGVKE
jgi:O-antigen ligase